MTTGRQSLERVVSIGTGLPPAWSLRVFGLQGSQPMDLMNLGKHLLHNVAGPYGEVARWVGKHPILAATGLGVVALGAVVAGAPLLAILAMLAVVAASPAAGAILGDLYTLLVSPLTNEPPRWETADRNAKIGGMGLFAAAATFYVLGELVVLAAAAPLFVPVVAPAAELAAPAAPFVPGLVLLETVGSGYNAAVNEASKESAQAISPAEPQVHPGEEVVKVVPGASEADAKAGTDETPSNDAKPADCPEESKAPECPGMVKALSLDQ